MKIQVTFFCDNGKYKPVVAVVNIPSSYDFYKRKKYWIARARKLVESKRYWSDEDMENFGYTITKAKICKE